MMLRPGASVAVVLASFGAGSGVAITAIVGGIVFAAFMLLIAPKLLAPLGRMAEREQILSQPISADACSRSC